jgi:hypothetical protein
MTINNVKLNFALSFVKNGFTIIPADDSKHPLIEWEEWKEEDKIPDETQILKWNEQFNNPNWAVITKKRLIILDFERYEDATTYFKNFEELKQQTLIVKTAHGGIHIYGINKGNEISRHTKIFGHEHEVDLLNGKGYALLPFSIIDHAKCDAKKTCDHTSKTMYEIISTTTEITETNNDNDFVQNIFQRAVELKWITPEYAKEKIKEWALEQNQNDNENEENKNLQLSDKAMELILEGIFAKNEKFKEIYTTGNYEKYGYASSSEAEEYLITILISLGIDNETINKIIKKSKTYHIHKYKKESDQDKYIEHSIKKGKSFIERSQNEQNENLENTNVLEFPIDENKLGLIIYDDEYTTIKLITFRKKQKNENEEQEETKKQEIEIVRFQGKIIRPVWIDEKEIGFEIERNNKNEALFINDVLTFLGKDYFLSNQKLYHLRQILESFITYTKNTKKIEYYYSTPIQVINDKIEVHYKDMEKINIEKNLRLIREYYNNATFPESFLSEFAFTLIAPLFYELKKKSKKGVQTPYFLKLGETKSGKTPQSYIFIGKGYDLNLEDYYFPYERIKTEFTMMKTLAKTNFPLIFDDITTDWILKNKENLKSYGQTNTFGSRGRGDQTISNYEGKSGLIFTMNTYLRPDEDLATTLRFIIFYYTIEHKKRVNRDLYTKFFNSLDDGFMFPIFNEIFGNKDINEILNIVENFTLSFDWIRFMINEINNLCKKYNIEPFPIPDYKYLTDVDNAYELFQAFVSEYERIEEAETQVIDEDVIKKMKYRSPFENEIKVEEKQNRIYVKFTAGAYKKMAKILNLPYKNVADFISNIYEHSLVKVAYNGKPKSIKIKYPQNPVKVYTLYIEKEQLNENDIIESIKEEFNLSNPINENDLKDYLIKEFDFNDNKTEKFINNLISNGFFKEKEIEANDEKRKVLEFQGGISK